MRHLKPLSFLVPAVLSLFLAASAVADSGYHIIKKIALGGELKWDYLNFDTVNRRIYLAHSSEVDVLNPTTGKIVATLPDTAGVHGAIPIGDAGIGYTSNGAANTSTLFDLKSLKVLMQVPTGQKPDAIGYDTATGCVYVCDGESEDVMAIEASTGATAGTIPLGGKPEYLAADGRGLLYVNLEDKDAVAVIDTRLRKLKQTFALPKGSSPSSMAIDKVNGKLFIGCRNKTLVVVDIRSGQVLQSLPIGDHVDATLFDSSTGNIFSSCGDGTLSIIHQDSPSAYSVVDNVKTMPGARTMTMDPETHQLYLPTVDNKVFTLLIVGQ